MKKCFAIGFLFLAAFFCSWNIAQAGSGFHSGRSAFRGSGTLIGSPESSPMSVVSEGRIGKEVSELDFKENGKVNVTETRITEEKITEIESDSEKAGETISDAPQNEESTEQYTENFPSACCAPYENACSPIDSSNFSSECCTCESVCNPCCETGTTICCVPRCGRHCRWHKRARWHRFHSMNSCCTCDPCSNSVWNDGCDSCCGPAEYLCCTTIRKCRHPWCGWRWRKMIRRTNCYACQTSWNYGSNSSGNHAWNTYDSENRWNSADILPEADCGCEKD